jgi:hypothetical protein
MGAGGTRNCDEDISAPNYLCLGVELYNAPSISLTVAHFFLARRVTACEKKRHQFRFVLPAMQLFERHSPTTSAPAARLILRSCVDGRGGRAYHSKNRLPLQFPLRIYQRELRNPDKCSVCRNKDCKRQCHCSRSWSKQRDPRFIRVLSRQDKVMSLNSSAADRVS